MAKTRTSKQWDRLIVKAKVYLRDLPGPVRLETLAEAIGIHMGFGQPIDDLLEVVRAAGWKTERKASTDRAQLIYKVVCTTTKDGIDAF